MKYVTSTFRLPEELYEEIRFMAYKENISLAEIIRTACKKYVKELKTKKE